MSTVITTPEPEGRDATPSVAVEHHPSGIYALPVIGRPATSVRGFYDDMRPTPEDSIGVATGKQIIRYGTVVATGTVGVAVGLIVAL